MKPITGNWQDARGNPASFGKLYGYLNQDAVALTANQIVPRQVYFQLDIQGALQDDAQIWANDELSPATTYYRFAVLDLGGGLIWGPEFLVLGGTGPIDFDTLVPTGGIPPVFTVSGVILDEIHRVPYHRGHVGIWPGYGKRNYGALPWSSYWFM